MAILFAIIAMFVVCGSAVTVVVSRISRVKLTVGKGVLSIAVTAVIAGTVASLLIAVLAKFGCTRGVPCEHAGFMEGGLLTGALWLLFYSIAYVVGAFVIARLQSQSQADAGNDA